MLYKAVPMMVTHKRHPNFSGMILMSWEYKASIMHPEYMNLIRKGKRHGSAYAQLMKMKELVEGVLDDQDLPWQ